MLNWKGLAEWDKVQFIIKSNSEANSPHQCWTCSLGIISPVLWHTELIMRTCEKLPMEKFPPENADVCKSLHFSEKLDALILVQTRGKTASKLASCLPRHFPCFLGFKGKAFVGPQSGSPSEELSQCCNNLTELWFWGLWILINTQEEIFYKGSTWNISRFFFKKMFHREFFFFLLLQGAVKTTPSFQKFLGM